MTFLDLAWEVMRQRKKDGVRGLDREWSRLRQHVATAPFANMAVEDIGGPDIRAWLRAMAEKDALGPGAPRKLSWQTINRCLSLVSAVFTEAVERELRKDNPCVGVSPKKRADESSTKAKWTYFTPEEEQAIATCEAIPEADRLAILFALYTGLRQGEQCCLELKDLLVDDANPRVVVRYGSRSRSGQRLPPKSGKVRDVPLIPRAIEVCRRWLALLDSFAPSNPEQLVFPTALGRRRQQGKPLGKHDTFGRHLKAAGLTKHARWHDLRHGAASALIAGWWGRQWPIHEVKSFLGHSSVNITERYAHLADTVLQDAARATELPKVAEPTLKGDNDSADVKQVFARGAAFVRQHLENTGALHRIASRMESAARGATSFARRVASRIATEVTRAA